MDPDQQKQTYLSIKAQQSPSEGPWFLIPYDWYKKWLIYTKQDGNEAMEVEKPGPLDTTILLEKGKLKSDLLENVDYCILSKSVW